MERIRRVLLEASGGSPATGAIALAFPTVQCTTVAASAAGVSFAGEAWDGAVSFDRFDEAIAAAAGDAIGVRGQPQSLQRVALEILTRYQRLVRRRNAASSGPAFDCVLLAHRALHDCRKPLVKADLDHAVDTWQWMLRLDPNVSLACQCAALFHDIERLESEADGRIEQHAPDYQAFKDAHAQRGGDSAYEVLCAAGIDQATARRARALVVAHERRSEDPEVALLNDADGLSFFSLNSPGYLRYFGREQARRKIAYTLRRLGRDARRALASVRLEPEVEALLDEVAA